MKQRLAWTLMMTALSASTASAQLPPGTRVRITATPELTRTWQHQETYVHAHQQRVVMRGPKRLIGTLAEPGDEGFLLVDAGKLGLVRVPLDAVVRIEVRDGPSRGRGALQGALLGTAIMGIVYGLPYVLADWRYVVYVPYFGVLTGAAPGALLGAAVGAGDRWVDPGQVKVGLVAPPRGPGAGIAVSWGFGGARRR